MPHAKEKHRRQPNVSRETLGGPDDHATVRVLTKALGPGTIDRGDGVVDDLAFRRGHRLELVVLAGSDHLLGRRLHDRDQLFALPGTEAVDVEEQAGPPL